MDEPKSLDSLFKDKIFRIPDYQRGYAWRKEQLKDFWEDLINLSGTRSHYTGVLTLKQIPDNDIDKSSKEHWLIDDQSYHVHHIVDGQQRLTTFIIFLQSFIDFVLSIPENVEKDTGSIYVSDSTSLLDIQNRYLFKTKPTGVQFRTYLFGYESDNPSYNYLRYKIFNEAGSGFLEETFYTLNLSIAKTYFTEQLKGLFESEGLPGLQEIYKKITKRFLFNEYVIKDEFDVFVAFETMNNRGKKLSDLELLKNRLIYLTTLYDDNELDPASRKNLRGIINDAWKEVYHQLGRNKVKPLNDDEFLRAHWIVNFKYSRKSGRDYIQFLLNDQFSPKNVLQKVEQEFFLETPEEVHGDETESELESNEETEDVSPIVNSRLKPVEIRNYANSLKESALHWYSTFFPDQNTDFSSEERLWVERLNRLGVGYFRPMMMSILKNFKEENVRISLFKNMERYIFINFRMNLAMTNYGSSEFYNVARWIERKEISPERVISLLNERLSYTFTSSKSFRINDFYNNLYKKFKSGSGYYEWTGLRYFLFEYEHSLLSESRNKKIDWNDLLKSETDKISIEHIYPQTETHDWDLIFQVIPRERRKNYCGSLGNLLLLSKSINSSLQNDGFSEKKSAKINESGVKVRNGYSDGSHSEIQVSLNEKWGPDQIRNRGIALLGFLQKRWDITLTVEDQEKLLFLDNEDLDMITRK